MSRMKCELCSEGTRINWGDANIVLCESCYGKDEGKKRLDNQSVPQPKNTTNEFVAEFNRQMSKKLSYMYLKIIFYIIVIVILFIITNK